ncbi:MAG: MBL fold metallo-hydrolase [Halanaerobium sp.]
MGNLKILAAESLGVRALCCLVEKDEQKILIDPGISLGYTRQGLLPHPIQIAVDEIIRENIIKELKEAADIVLSHFHGDHIPFREANVYQIKLEQVKEHLKEKNIWAKSAESDSHKFQERAWDLKFNSTHFTEAEGRSSGVLSFSQPVYHGEEDSFLGEVMMTKVKLEDKIFVHASDIQFFYRPTIEKLIEMQPDLVIASGPPLYLSHVDQEMASKAAENILLLSNEVETLIVDHHLLRSEAGLTYLRELNDKSPNQIISAADFMGIKPCLLEARRKELYQRFPVPADWHQDYEAGLEDTADYLLQAREKLLNFEELFQYFKS